MCVCISVCVCECQRGQSRALHKHCPCVAFAPINLYNQTSPPPHLNTSPSLKTHTNSNTKSSTSLASHMLSTSRNRGSRGQQGHMAPVTLCPTAHTINNCRIGHLRWLSQTFSSLHPPTHTARRSVPKHI